MHSSPLFVYISIHELITQQITGMQHNALYTSSKCKKQVGDYKLSDCTSYEVNDYLTINQLNKQRDEYTASREILTDNNIDFID